MQTEDGNLEFPSYYILPELRNKEWSKYKANSFKKRVEVWLGEIGWDLLSLISSSCTLIKYSIDGSNFQLTYIITKLFT